MLFYFNFFSSQAPPLARWQQRTHLCIVRQHLFEREEPQREILSWAAAGIISSLGEGVCCLSVCQLHTLSTPSSLPTFSSCTPLSRRKHANLKICTKVFAQNHLVNGKGGIFRSIRHCSVGPSFFCPSESRERLLQHSMDYYYCLYYSWGRRLLFISWSFKTKINSFFFLFKL